MKNFMKEEPTRCPYCGGTDLVEIGQWNAQSTLEGHNAAILTEWQCLSYDCTNASFWS